MKENGFDTLKGVTRLKNIKSLQDIKDYLDFIKNDKRKLEIKGNGKIDALLRINPASHEGKEIPTLEEAPEPPSKNESKSEKKPNPYRKRLPGDFAAFKQYARELITM